MIGIVDYGVGNLFSVQNSLTFLGAQSCLVSQPDQLKAVDALLLPGVGAFRDAMARLVDSGLVEAIRAQAQKKPLLGICLGMQLLFDHGYEFGDTPGLGLIPGSVSKIDAGGQKLPHMGWNELRVVHPSPLSKGVSDGDYVYFVHSYCASTDDRYLCLDTQYGQRIPALVQNGMVYGAQFHPEKSAATGLQILRNFAGLSSERMGVTI